MVAKPEEVYAHSAMFYEELLIQRDVERSLLPHCSFLDRLIGATSTSNFSMETMVAPGRPTDSLSHSGACLRYALTLATHVVSVLYTAMTSL